MSSRADKFVGDSGSMRVVKARAETKDAGAHSHTCGAQCDHDGDGHPDCDENCEFKAKRDAAALLAAEHRTVE